MQGETVIGLATDAVHQLKSEVENFAARLTSSNTFFRKVKAGKISKREVGIYVYNIWEVIKLTPVHMRKSIESSDNSGMTLVKEFFEERYPEEQNHHLWAENDLNQLNFTEDKKKELFITQGIKRLIPLLDLMSEKNPVGYIAYNFLVEYLTVLSAPNLIRDLEEKCNISKNQLSVLGNHVETDKNHILEDLKVLSNIFSTYPEKCQFMPEIRKCMGFLDFNFEEIAQGNT